MHMEYSSKHRQIIDFLKEIEQFKTCERSCHTTRIGRAESDAEHSWHLALFLILLEAEFKDIDFLKLIKIALIHDLPEIYAGDNNPYRGSTENKEQNEKMAAAKLFANLPDTIKSQFTLLIDEYINQGSPEARIVKSADKIMPLIQNLCTNETYSSYRQLEVSFEEVEEYMAGFFEADGILKNIYEQLLLEAKEKGVFFDETNIP